MMMTERIVRIVMLANMINGTVMLPSAALSNSKYDHCDDYNDDDYYHDDGRKDCNDDNGAKYDHDVSH